MPVPAEQIDDVLGHLSVRLHELADTQQSARGSEIVGLAQNLAGVAVTIADEVPDDLYRVAAEAADHLALIRGQADQAPSEAIRRAAGAAASVALTMMEEVRRQVNAAKDDLSGLDLSQVVDLGDIEPGEIRTVGFN